MSTMLDALLAAIGDYDRAVKACETSVFDDTLQVELAGRPLPRAPGF